MAMVKRGTEQWRTIAACKGGASSECWEWQHKIGTDGYGYVRYQGKQVGTHRLSYMLHKGTLIRGMMINHICHNRKCWNPAHLEQVTVQQNNQYRVGANTTNKSSGIWGVSYYKNTNK